MPTKKGSADQMLGNRRHLRPDRGPGQETLAAYRIDGRDRIVAFDEAWCRFARENGAPELAERSLIGQPLDRFIADWDTRQLYALIYRKVRETGTPLALLLRCDSPERRRLIRLELSPYEHQGIELIAEAVRIEDRPPVPLMPSGQGDPNRIVGICSWCKKIRLDEEHWAEIEEALGPGGLFAEPSPPRLSHGICPDCFAEVRKAVRA